MPEWGWIVLVGTVVCSLAAAVWYAHERRDNERDRAIWDQIGRDSHSGMRKTLHALPNAVLKVQSHFERLKDRVHALERPKREKRKPPGED